MAARDWIYIYSGGRGQTRYLRVPWPVNPRPSLPPSQPARANSSLLQPRALDSVRDRKKTITQTRHCDRLPPPKMANPHPIAKFYPEKPFHAKNSIKSGVNGALVGGAAGLIASAIQNSLAKTNVGAFGIFTRTGGTVATLSTCAREESCRTSY